MIIKVILFVFIYLLIGIITLEGIAWYDRKSKSVYKWVEDHDDVDNVIVVLMWPILLPIIGVCIFFVGLAYLIKGIRIFYTTIVYLIIVFIKNI